MTRPHPRPLRTRVSRWAVFCAAGTLGFVGACQSKSPAPSEVSEAQGTTEAQPDPEGASGTPANARSYGEPLSRRARVDLAELVRAPQAHAGKTVLVEGHVRRACSAKGCWLEIATSEAPEAPGCRVTFKDYGFFVPTDSAGSTARVEGIVEVTEVEKAHVEHLEGEGATFDTKKGDGSAMEVRVVATGVELRRG